MLALCIFFDLEEGENEEGGEEDDKTDDDPCSCNISLTRSMGAVMVREKVPAMAPATAFLKAWLDLLVLAVVVESLDDDDDDDDDDEEETAGLVTITLNGCIIDGDIVMFSFDEDSRCDDARDTYFGDTPLFIPSFFSSVLVPCHSGLGRFMLQSLPYSVQ